MSGRGGRVDYRIPKAVAFKLCCGSASIPESMHASKFTLAESLNPAKQMAVRRAYEKLIGGKTMAAPASVLLSATSHSSMSPMTELPRTESSAKTVGMASPTPSLPSLRPIAAPPLLRCHHNRCAALPLPSLRDHNKHTGLPSARQQCLCLPSALQ